MTEKRFVLMPDGTFAPNKLGDAIKTLVVMKSDYKSQINQFKNRLPEQTILLMRRRINAIETILPVIEYELKRRKANAE